MAILMKIKTPIKGKLPGDIVAVFNDSHIFDQNELNRFDFETIKGTKEEVYNQLKSLVPISRDTETAKEYLINGEWGKITPPVMRFSIVDGIFVENYTKNIIAKEVIDG